MRPFKLTVCICILVTFVFTAFPESKSDTAVWWAFDEGQGRVAIDRINSVEDKIRGLVKYVDGVSGKALKFDGFSSSVTREAARFPRLNREFSIEAWIALGAYPWNWAPILAQDNQRITGFYFGIDSSGNLGFHISDGSAVWQECNSQPAAGKLLGMDLHRWYHVVGTFSRRSGLTIYVNGRLAGNQPVNRGPVFASYRDVIIGRNHDPLPPTDPVRAWATYPSAYSFDGIIDELKVHNRELSAEEVRAAHLKVKIEKDPEFEPRRFPSLESRSGRFAANFSTLKYYEEWDNLWPVGAFSDIVVQFDLLPVNVMFWRGTRYSPCWVSENGKWMADQSRETGYNWFLQDGPRADMPTGCLEHMSDTQCRSSRVSIIENHNARVLVHWRYLQMDVRFRQKDLNNQTGFGEWADEYYYIYPDGVAVRKLGPGRGGWQETIFLSEPGTRPEDNCELEAITLVNSKGESATYSWEKGFPTFDLADPVIQMTNLKSKYRPFMILRPGARWMVFRGEVRPGYSHFPWWNHWPVAQVISDGRYANAADRAAHSSLCWGGPRGDVALYGMTDQPAATLITLERSWNNPAKMQVEGTGFVNNGYDVSQRAYIIDCQKPGEDCLVELKASDESPLLNPAFVLKNWGLSKPQLELDGQTIPEGKTFRRGIRHSVDGSVDLIVWLKTESNKTVKLRLSGTK